MCVWFLALLFTKASLSFELFNSLFYIFPITMISMYVLFMLWPFHWFYFSLRKAIIKLIFSNLFPLGKNGVRFKDFMFGDILTSLTRPLATLTLSFCLLGCGTCKDLNVREDCDRNGWSALILTLLPFVIRFFQCLNRFYYTNMAWPHLGNAIKYIGGIVYNYLSWCYSNSKYNLLNIFL
jgi:hypothetical protein